MLDKKRLSAAGIDVEGALERFAGNVEIYEKYLNRFQTDTHMAAVEDAMKNGNYQKVLEEAHAMKGMTGTLGMDELFSACSDVVTAVRNSQEDSLPELVEHMKFEFDRVMSVYQ